MKIKKFKFNELQETMLVVDNDEMLSFWGGNDPQCVINLMINGGTIYKFSNAAASGNGYYLYMCVPDTPEIDSIIQKYFSSVKMERSAFLLILMLLSFISCKCVYSEYIKETDVLYVSNRFAHIDTCFVYTNRFGEIVFPDARDPKAYYKQAKPFSCGLAIIMDQSNNWKYINNQGEVIIDASDYTWCWGFEEPMAPAVGGFKKLAYVSIRNENGDKYGLINLKGKIVLPIDYNLISGPGFSDCYLEIDNLWVVRKNELWGVLNRKVKFIIPLKYNAIEAFSRGSALVQLDGYWGLINKKGKTIFPFQLTEIGQKNWSIAKNEPRYLVKKDLYWGIINHKGKIIIPFTYIQWDNPGFSPWEITHDYYTIRLFKEDGSFIKWNIREDKYID